MVAARDGRNWLLEPNQPGRLDYASGPFEHAVDQELDRLSPAAGVADHRASDDGSSEGRELARVPGSVPVHIEDVSADGSVALFRDSTSTLFSVRLDGVAADVSRDDGPDR